MSTQTLAETFSTLLENCKASEAGRLMLAMHDQTVQFTPLDGDPFYFEAKGGQGKISGGQMPERPLTEGHEIKVDIAVFREWFSGQARMSDLIEHGRMFPVASHTTKRHIDYWLAQIVRLGNRLKIPKEVY